MIHSEWMMVGTARKPGDSAGAKHPLLRHQDGRYVLIVDPQGTQQRVSKDYGRSHDQTRDAAAVALGGRTSEKKAQAARRNGLLGGGVVKDKATPVIPRELRNKPKGDIVRGMHAQGHSYAAIGRRLGLTRERVRQLAAPVAS